VIDAATGTAQIGAERNVDRVAASAETVKQIFATHGPPRDEHPLVSAANNREQLLSTNRGYDADWIRALAREQCAWANIIHVDLNIAISDQHLVSKLAKKGPE
jgi:hypothetical protein